MIEVGKNYMEEVTILTSTHSLSFLSFLYSLFWCSFFHSNETLLKVAVTKIAKKNLRLMVMLVEWATSFHWCC